MNGSRLMKSGLMALLLATALVALADTEIDESRPVHATATVTIALGRGELSVRGTETDDVTVRGEIDSRGSLAWAGDRDDLSVTLADDGAEAELEVLVPRGISLVVRTVTADVWIDAIDGDLTVQTVNGELRIAGEPRSVTVSGVSGDLVLDVPTDTVDLTWESGDVIIDGARERIACTVASGDVEIRTGPRLTALDCDLLVGDLVLRGPVPAAADWTIDLQVGDLRLAVEDPIDARFEVTTMVGDITSDLATILADDEIGPMRTQTLESGSGRGLVRVVVLQGDVTVAR